MKIKKIFGFMIAFLITGLLSINNPFVCTAATSSAAVALNTTTTYLVKGETTALKVTGTSAKAIWKSNNKKIATVLPSGKVTAVTYGTTTIIATVNKKNYSCKVTVVDPSNLSLEPSATILMVGGKEVSLNPKSYIYSAAAIDKMGLTYKVTGNDGIKVSSKGIVTATKAGNFNVAAYIHGKKIETVSIKAEEFKGFSDLEASVKIREKKEIYFADNYKLYDELYDGGVNITSSDPKVVDAELAYTVENLDYYYGIKITGVTDGTATVSVTVSGVTRQIKVSVGIGATVLAPVDAVKTGDYTGYTGNSLETLKWVRNFIDSNNLMSATMTDREKVTIIQNYFIQNFNVNVSDTVYQKSISRLLFNGEGTCGDYATTFSFLCECINIPCYYVEGSCNIEGGWVGHAWNKVKVDGDWFYTDPSWCAAYQSLNTYFLATDIWSDHKFREEGYYSDMANTFYAPYVTDLG